MDIDKELEIAMLSSKPLLDILREVQNDAELWNSVVMEIDPKRPDIASDFLKSLMDFAEVSGEMIETTQNCAIVLVALHNAVGCARNPNAKKRPEIAQHVPCTTMTFKIISYKDNEQVGYELTFAGEVCMHDRRKER